MQSMIRVRRSTILADARRGAYRADPVVRVGGDVDVAVGAEGNVGQAIVGAGVGAVAGAALFAWALDLRVNTAGTIVMLVGAVLGGITGYVAGPKL